MKPQYRLLLIGIALPFFAYLLYIYEWLTCYGEGCFFLWTLLLFFDFCLLVGSLIALIGIYNLKKTGRFIINFGAILFLMGTSITLYILVKGLIERLLVQLFGLIFWTLIMLLGMIYFIAGIIKNIRSKQS